jgi:multidrug efflux pump subunit AcrB
MILNQAALKRQATVLALLVVIVIAGIYCYATLPRESFPDITIPYVFVTTTAPRILSGHYDSICVCHHQL